MGIGTHVYGEVAAATASGPAVTAVPNVITWTANEPTASSAQTIADGTVPTVAELGQVTANLTKVIDALIVDVAANNTAIDAVLVDNAAMLAALNAGEGS